MNERCVAIQLKIPDNEAYTAVTTLQRLGVRVARLERAEIWRLNDSGDAATLAQRIERNETIFNPNKHVLTILDARVPRPGETWIGELPPAGGVAAHVDGKGIADGKGIEGVTRAQRYVGWRLLDAAGKPAARDIVEAAVERLLCNPAIERATYQE
jgi:phosphoribosylformylglycinamidine (FGAM) synthase PurS component